VRATKATKASGLWRPLAARAGDPGSLAARLLCCTPNVARNSSGVGGLRPARVGHKDWATP
jgi:hypothetical protein